MAGNDIVILDNSASRFHARIELNPQIDALCLYDLESTNGTFLNRVRLCEPQALKHNDVIRIGVHTLEITNQTDQDGGRPRPQNTHLLTRELVLESIDQHGLLLSEVASKLNSLMDLETALQTVSDLMKTAMGADRCNLILKEKFDRLTQLGFARTIAQQALEERSAILVQDAQTGPSFSKSAALLNISAAMCVPVISGDDILALIYVYKSRPRAKPFSQSDLQLAVAIGNQAALTIQRMQLLEKIRQEEILSRLLHRFLSPQEAEYVLEKFIETGELPSLEEHNITIIATDICNSTVMAERLGSKRFSKVLEHYYQTMTDIVFNYHGSLNKYIGDGLMAVFGMPHQPDRHEVRAVQTAIDMLDQLEHLNKKLGEEITIGIGVNSGQSMAGYVGTQEYLEFTVIGYPVNIAWGLESLARPNRIFIGHPTYQNVCGKFPIRTLGNLKLKRPSEVIQVYEVVR